MPVRINQVSNREDTYLPILIAELEEKVSRAVAVCLAYKCIKERLAQFLFSLCDPCEPNPLRTWRFASDAVEAPLLAFPASDDFCSQRHQFQH